MTVRPAPLNGPPLSNMVEVVIYIEVSTPNGSASELSRVGRSLDVKAGTSLADVASEQAHRSVDAILAYIAERSS